MKSGLLIALLTFTSFALADTAEIIKCKISNKEWTSTITLNSAGEGILKFQKTGDDRFYVCSMRLNSLSDRRRAVSPNVTARFSLGECDPDIYSYEKDILRSITLIVNFDGDKPSDGLAQWLSNKQPDTCEVEKMKVNDVAMNAKKAAKGKFGRRPASAPAKFRKKF